MHHEQYDDNDILAHTIELCPRCHRKAEFDGYVKASTKGKYVQVKYNTWRRLIDVAEYKTATYSTIIDRCCDAYERERHG
jgi:macrodomain Ter protein organizer (MatP/YcbG family)